MGSGFWGVGSGSLTISRCLFEILFFHFVPSVFRKKRDDPSDVGSDQKRANGQNAQSNNSESGIHEKVSEGAGTEDKESVDAASKDKVSEGAGTNDNDMDKNNKNVPKGDDAGKVEKIKSFSVVCISQC